MNKFEPGEQIDPSVTCLLGCPFFARYNDIGGFMQVNSSSTLSILHDGQFWVGICEHEDGGAYEARRIVFGPHEPTDEVVLAFVCEQWGKLGFGANMRPSLSDDREARETELLKRPTKINPKRMQRTIHRAIERRGVSTKAQQAIRDGYEAGKSDRRKQGREERLLAEERRYEFRRQKRKEKKRGH